MTCVLPISTFFALPCVVLTSLALAGPLNPPPGPVTSTGKTLTDVEPRIAVNAANTPGTANVTFRITAPGSYYLTSNIPVPAVRAIDIAAPNVTLDLNGFEVRGTIGNSGSGVSNVTIRNGTIVGGLIVMNFTGNQATDCTFENLTFVLSANEGFGDLFRTASGTVVRNIRARASGISGAGIVAGIGITVGPRAMISDVVIETSQSPNVICLSAGAMSNLRNVTTLGGSQGIVVGQYSTLKDCKVTLASSGTLGAFQLGNGSIASDCTAFDNEGPGFTLANNVRLTNCEATENANGGFVSPTANSVILNACIADSNLNAPNIQANGFALITNSTARGGTNGGIALGAGARVDASTAVNNSGVGIAINSGSIVNSQAINSTGGGITAGARSIISRTTVNNGGTGIGVRLTAFPARLEDSAIFNCNTGYQSDFQAAAIIRNQFSGNALAGNNAGGPSIFGPFITTSADLATPASPFGNINP